MRLILINMLTLLLGAGVSASAWGGILYDGSGDPSTAGFVYFATAASPPALGTLADKQAYEFTLDSQGDATGSSPGYLLQNGAVDEDGGFRLTSPVEFNRAAGWTVETRLKLNTTSTASGATGQGFGMFFIIADDVRDWHFGINPSRITSYYNGAPGGADVYADAFEYHGGASDGGGPDVDMRQYHTLKFVQPAGGANGSLKVFFDDVLTDLNTGNAYSGFGRVSSLEFQDDGGGDAAGVYDYIAINTAAPAIPLAEITVHTPVNATVIKGGTGNLGFSMINSAPGGSQNLTTTSIVPPALPGTSYSPIANVSNLPPGSNTGNLPFTATTSALTPAGANVITPTITGNASNSPFTPIYDDSPTLTVLDHSNGSFAETSDVNALTIDFGSRVQGSGSQPGGYEAIPFDVFNLINTQDFTARLELYMANVSATGDAPALFPYDVNGDHLPAFFGLGAGETEALFAVLDTNVELGTYSATWTFGVEDHNAFNGHVANTIPLTLTLKGKIVLSFPGDVNNDGFVDIFDVNLVSSNWGSPGGPTGDANGDGNVDIFDINLISSNWSPASGGVSAVPEPGGAAPVGSLFLGLTGAMVARVRKHRVHTKLSYAPVRPSVS